MQKHAATYILGHRYPLNYCYQPSPGSRLEHGFYFTQYIHRIFSRTSVFWAPWIHKGWQSPDNLQNSSFLPAGNIWTLLKVILGRRPLVIAEKRHTLNRSALGRGEHLGLQMGKASWSSVLLLNWFGDHIRLC